MKSKACLLTLYQSASLAWRTLYFSLATVMIFVLSYILGHAFLEGYLGGNDMPHHLTTIAFFDKWFPQIPGWFPFQGGGVDLQLYSYEGAQLWVIFISRLLHLDIIRATLLVSFLTVPLTALGIYLFVWSKFRNQTVALISGIFFILLPTSWINITHGGLLGQQLGVMFLPYALLLADLYLFSVVSKQQMKAILSLFAFAITGLLIAFTHGLTYAILLAAVGLMYFFHALIFPFPSSSRIKSLMIALVALFKLAGVSLLMTALPLLDIQNITKAADREGLSNPAAHDLPFMTINTLFGIYEEALMKKFDTLNHLAFFPIYFVYLFALGTVMSIIRRHKVLVLAIIAIIALVYSTIPFYVPPLAALFVSFFFYAVRAVILPFILLPIVAAFGVYLLAETVFFTPFWVVEKITHIKVSIFKPLGILVVSVVVLVITPLYIINTRHLQNQTTMGDIYRGYGPFGCVCFDTFWEQKPNKTYDWTIAGLVNILQDNLFPIKLEGKPPLLSLSLQEYMKKLGATQFDRIDISPYHGQLVENLNIMTDVPQLSLYSYNLSLFHSNWGFQQGSFYSKKFGSPESLAELANWMGLKYVFLHPTIDPIEKYQNENWKEQPPLNIEAVQSDAGPYARVFENLSNPGLATWSNKPVILVLGNFEKRPYEQIFRLAVNGIVSAKDAMLVEGKESGKIDDYSPEELKQFSMILLHGYTYGNRDKAWNLLKNYLSDGGSVFINTGWQYTSPNWQEKELPEFFPVKSLSWQGIGRDWQGGKLQTDITEGLDLNKFGDLAWSNTDWSVSTTLIGDLRSGAEAVLVKNNQVVMARSNFGKGKIFWTGLNLPAHALDKDYNQEEITLMKKVIGWLIQGNPQTYTQFNFQRPNPDRLEFSFNQSTDGKTTLFWREGFSTRWKATLIQGNSKTQELKAYRGGAGMLLYFVPPLSSGAKIIMTHQEPFIIQLAKIISLGTFLILLLILIDGAFFKSRLFSKFKLKLPFTLRLIKINKWWEDDEES